MPVHIRTATGNAERAVFIGLTRSGKTVLVQSLLASCDSVVVLDTKHKDEEWLPFAEHFGYTVTRDPALIRRHARVLFRVDIAAVEDRTHWAAPGSLGYEGWTQVLRAIRWRGNTIAHFDEGQDTLPHQGVHPDARRMATSDAAHGTSLWLNTQSPDHIDTRILANAEHCFSFELHNEEYLSVVRRRRGLDPSPLTELERFEFAYHRLGTGEWELYEPVTPVNLRTVRPLPNSEAPPAEAHDVRLTEAEPSPITPA